MTSQRFTARTRLGAAACSLVLAPVLSAQIAGIKPGPNAAYIMVPVFHSTDRALATQAAGSMRSRITSEFPAKEVWVVPVEQINGQLTASGFPTTEALPPYDASTLAKSLRADEYIDADVSRTATGFRVNARLVLSRESKLVQPLGSFEAPKLDAAMQLATKELKEARKQLDAERKCVNAARDGKYPEAIAFARTGIAAYPKATLSRICLASVLDVSKAPADSVLKVTREILALDPLSYTALRIAANTYKANSEPDSAVAMLTRLVASDPTDAHVYTELLWERSRRGEPTKVLASVDTALMAHPGDAELLRLRWLLLFAARDYKSMFAQGDEILKYDTAFADTTYFYRTALAYAADSAPQKAAEVAALGVAKFPGTSSLVGLQIQALIQAGQLQQALEALDKAQEKNIAVERAGTVRIKLLRDLKRTSEVLPVIRTLVAKGDTSAELRQFAVAQGNEERSQGQAAKDTALLARALGTLAYADSISKGNEKISAQFQMGATNVVIAGFKIGFAQADKSCALFKESKNHLVDAQIQLPKGGQTNPDVMRTLMNSALQMDTFVDSELKRMNCK